MAETQKYTKIERQMQAAYDQLPYVGWYRVLAGSHHEGGRTYLANDALHTKSTVMVPQDRDKFQEITPSESEIEADKAAVAKISEAMAASKKAEVELEQALAEA